MEHWRGGPGARMPGHRPRPLCRAGRQHLGHEGQMWSNGWSWNLLLWDVKAGRT